MEVTQEAKKNKIALIALIAVAVLAVALVVYYYLSNYKKRSSIENLESAIEQSESNITVSSSANPFEQMAPESTPVEKTNPFKYENPFK